VLGHFLLNQRPTILAALALALFFGDPLLL